MSNPSKRAHRLPHSEQICHRGRWPRTRMTFTYFLMLAAVLLMASLPVFAQSSDIVGTWILTGADKILPNGTRVMDYGPQPHGLVIFTADGHYSVQIYRAERPMLPSDDKADGALQAYKDVSHSMSVHFGRYTVDPVKHTITFNVDRSSHPNWDDTTQIRSYQLNGDELSWQVARRPDGSIPVTTVRRVK